jgi:hypothetical protein
MLGSKQDKAYIKKNVSTLILRCSNNYHKVASNYVKVCVK